MSVEDHTVSFSLEVNVEEAYAELRRLQTLLYRSLSLLSRLGLPENVENMIREVQRAIAILNQLRLTLIAVQAASGPIGWGLAAVSAITTAVTIGEEVAYGMRGA